MYKANGVEPNPKGWKKIQARLSRFLLNVTLKHFLSPLTPWPRNKPNKVHVDQEMIDFSFEFGFWNGTHTLVIVNKKNKSLKVCTCTVEEETHLTRSSWKMPKDNCDSRVHLMWEPLVSCMALAKYISCFLSSPPFSLNLYCQLYHPYDCFIPLNVFYIASFPWTSIFCSYPCLPSTQEGGRIHQSLFIINFYFSFFYNKFYRFKKHANQKKI